ncbi:MAG: hypothetical protein QGH83_07665 [Candidatus Pacebacteria bacterium]|jgi:hypothetical protein|nr:hypothetical protein [Candidatus Paceibacterota bacterium]
MSVIMPAIEKYEVCEYTNKSIPWSGMSKDALAQTLANRKFKVVAEFDEIEDARKYIYEFGGKPREDKPWVYEYSHLVIRFVFKEIEPDESVH